VLVSKNPKNAEAALCHKLLNRKLCSIGIQLCIHWPPNDVLYDMRMLIAFATSIVQGLLGLQHTSSLSSEPAASGNVTSNALSYPSLQLVSTPRWNRDNTTTEAINATLIVGGRRLERHQNLMEMVLESGKVPSMDYIGAEAIRAWDKKGELALSTEIVDTMLLRRWSVSRETVGEIRHRLSEKHYQGYSTGTSNRLKSQWTWYGRNGSSEWGRGGRRV
jgi:hypothetical protein